MHANAYSGCSVLQIKLTSTQPDRTFVFSAAAAHLSGESLMAECVIISFAPCLHWCYHEPDMHAFANELRYHAIRAYRGAHAIMTGAPIKTDICDAFRKLKLSPTCPTQCYLAADPPQHDCHHVSAENCAAKSSVSLQCSNRSRLLTASLTELCRDVPQFFSLLPYGVVSLCLTPYIECVC